MNEIYVKAKVKCDVCSSTVEVEVPLNGASFKLDKNDLAWQLSVEGWHYSKLRCEYVCSHCAKEY